MTGVGLQAPSAHCPQAEQGISPRSWAVQRGTAVIEQHIIKGHVQSSSCLQLCCCLPAAGDPGVKKNSSTSKSALQPHGGKGVSPSIKEREEALLGGLVLAQEWGPLSEESHHKN